MQFDQAKAYISNRLKNELPPYLTYHNLVHVLDVCDAAARLATAEGVQREECTLLLTAAMYHDSGYLIQKENHESISCTIARESLPRFNYTPEQTERVCEIIMATRIPQQPDNLLEKIICDADLDYLGRDDFFRVSQRLFEELKATGDLQHEMQWDQIQVQFLEQHHYFTQTAIRTRKKQKDIHLTEVKKKLPPAQPTATVTPQRQHHDNWLQDMLYIISGAVIYGFGLESFLIPNKFLDGGVTGISLLLQQLFGWNITLVIILANIPLIILGAVQISKKFAIKTVTGIVLLGLCITFIHFPVLRYDKLLLSVFGGFFLGIGSGLAMRGGCALDGMEVLAVYTLRRTSFTISEIILAFNAIIFLVGAFKFGFDVSLYAILTYYIVTRTINYVVEGVEEFTGVTIISGQSEAIKEKLVKDLGRGITVYKGERGYLPGSFEERYEADIIFTVITRLEVRQLRRAVSQIDEKAFVFTHTIKETAGGILKRHVSH